MTNDKLILTPYLTPDLVQLNLTVGDWEAAIRAGGQLLLNAGKCTTAYVDAMVKAVHELGPYIALAPGLALAHARPEDGVLALGFSLVTLDPAIAFGSEANDPIEVMICFCAPDSESHISILEALAVRLRDLELQQRLRLAETIAEALSAFVGVADEKESP